MKNVQLLPLEEHAWNLFRVISGIAEEYVPSFDQVSDWLHLSCGVSNVDVITARFDQSVLWCSNVAAFENERSKEFSTLTTAIVRFQFIWCAVESLIEVIEKKSKLKKREDQGKISWACAFLKTAQIKQPPMIRTSYTSILSSYERAILNDNYFLKLITDNNGFSRRVGYFGMGLNSVYKIRNAFAHGSLQLLRHDRVPFFEGDTDTELIDLSSRIVLLTIQMLILAFLGRNDFEIEVFDLLEIEVEDTASIIELLGAVQGS